MQRAEVNMLKDRLKSWKNLQRLQIQDKANKVECNKNDLSSTKTFQVPDGRSMASQITKKKKYLEILIDYMLNVSQHQFHGSENLDL